MNYGEAEAFLHRLGMFGIKLGLAQVRELFDLIGAPDRNLSFIHLAGSNGKGSTAAFLMAALRNCGFCVGFYSSPHLVSPRERFRINGKSITEERMAELLTKMATPIENMRLAGRCPTYFEVTTALAALYFAEEKVDFVIWETGMGGRFDATNIVDPICSIITGISLEHTEYLGDTIAQIAGEKAGIIKNGRPVFIAAMTKEADAVIRRKAHEQNAEVFAVPDSYYRVSGVEFDEKAFSQSFTAGPYHLRSGLAGDMQQRNAMLAVTVLEYLSGKFCFDLDTALRGFALARWPGRIQRLCDGLLLDGAHNPEGAQILIKTLVHFYPGEKFTFIFGNFMDKDTEAILKILYPLARGFVFVPIMSERPCRAPEWLCAAVAKLGNVPAVTASCLKDATMTHVSGTRVIAGSLYLAGEALSLFCSPAEIFDI